MTATALVMSASTVAGAVDPSTGDTVPVTVPLVPIPVGCEPPPAPDVVFVGAVAERDVRSVRFVIESVRAGDPTVFAPSGPIDIRYGLDAQYLEIGEQYLVGALIDPDLGVLVSRVTDPIEDFGGDEVIGVSDSDVECPDFEDPIRTLHPDGTALDAGVLSPFLGARTRILVAVLLPAAVGFAVIFLLASLRLSLAGVYRGLIRSRRR